MRAPSITAFLLPLAILLGAFAAPAQAEIQPNNLFPRVKMVTSEGDIIVELNRDRAPITVKNFLRYVEKAQYNQTIFHRIVPDFVVQGGGYDASFEAKPTFETIVNESGNGLENKYGTLAMARERGPHTASRQFFFNLDDNSSLNPSPRRWGYTVFGHIVEGEDVLKQLAGLESMAYDEKTGWNDVPVEPPVLERIEIIPAPQ